MEPVFVAGDAGVAALPIGVGEGVDRGDVLSEAFDPGVLEAVVGLGDAGLASGDQGGLGVPAGGEFAADVAPDFVVDDFAAYEFSGHLKFDI